MKPGQMILSVQSITRTSKQAGMGINLEMLLIEEPEMSRSVSGSLETESSLLWYRTVPPWSKMELMSPEGTKTLKREDISFFS